MDALTLELQLVVDKLYMGCPYYGSRRVMFHLRREGYAVGRTKARSLMAAVGWRTVHPGPRTTKPQPGHKIYPYLLRDLGEIRPGEVICADITYIPGETHHPPQYRQRTLYLIDPGVDPLP